MAGTLAHWEPFAEIAELRSRFDRMLGELGNGHEREWTPAIDVRRDEDRLVVRAGRPRDQAGRDHRPVRRRHPPAKKIKARSQDGVLEVEVPLPKEATKEPITITPRAGS